MQTYAIIGGLLLLVGFVIWFLIRKMRGDQKDIGTMAQVVKDQNLDLKVIEAQRDQALAKRTDPTKPDEILGGL